MSAPIITVFDIETAPLSLLDLEGSMPEFSAPANYKDEAKIAACIVEKQNEWFSRAALSPQTGQVIAIGTNIDGVYDSQINVIHDAQSEAQLIKWFWDKLEKSSLLVGFNSHHFDLPFLIKRSWKLGITPPPIFHNRRFVNSIDLMDHWQFFNKGADRISLDNFAKFLGVGSKSMSGALFYTLLGEQPEIAAEYLENDVALTLAIAQKIGAVPLAELDY